jgi:hypothetical protein
MTAVTNYQLVFPPWYDSVAETEVEAKGWLQGVEVRFPSGLAQALFFYDPVRLAQDLEEEAKFGLPFVASPGLIVIPRITRSTIEAAVQKLVEEDYFPIGHSPAGCSLNEVIHEVRPSPAA